MKVDLKEILSATDREIEKKVPLDVLSFDSKMGRFPILKKDEVELHIQNKENKKLLIQGNTDLIIGIPCDRCLEEVPTAFHLDIDREIPLRESPDTDEEKIETEDYILGTELDLDRIIYDEILVDWPMKVLCKEDCRGICKKCGQDLNHGTCDCEQTELDPRMAVIQDVFRKFKEV